MADANVTTSMTPEQLMDDAILFREMAREFHQAGDYRRAGRCETRALSLTVYAVLRLDAAADRYAEEGVMIA